jgi:hypothetical protein
VIWFIEQDILAPRARRIKRRTTFCAVKGLTTFISARYISRQETADFRLRVLDFGLANKLLMTDTLSFNQESKIANPKSEGGRGIW